MKYFVFIFCLGFLVSCHQPEPRKPVVKKSGQFLKKSAARNRALQTQQEQEILQVIKQDSLHEYLSSANGFWYRYDHKIEEDLPLPQFGDVVNFNYNIYTIHGEPIYSTKEIGTREYKIDKEDLLSGLRLGLKLMKEGETITFYFPSSVAFDYHGDDDKIGRNLPLRITVTLNSIK